VHNAAVLLVDTRDMGVKVMLGSADFFNQKIQGEINGTNIKRSPGSTLKPFIYALAMEQGLIHPGTILKDVPSHFGSYQPENFDNDFMGPVSAQEALALSRNIPAIDLAQQLTSPSLYTFLQQANIKNLKSENYYGLALVLGGAEVSMQELVTLYAMLANKGVWQPLRFTPMELNKIKKPLLSPEASFLTLDMLKENSKDDTFLIATKTGTSSAFRDAWTVGVIGPYVLAVWIGNFNNQSNPAFIGKEVADPLWHEIAHALLNYAGSLPLLYPYPSTLKIKKVEVCAASGMLPTKYCTQRKKVWFIPGKSPITTDTVYREVAIDRRTGLQTCHFNRNTQFEVYEFWPSDLLHLFQRAGIARRVPPPYEAGCVPHDQIGLSPRMTSPQIQTQYIVKVNEKEILIPLSAVVDADVHDLYWFENDTFLGKSLRDQTYMWHAEPGQFVIRVIDDHGRAEAREVVVKLET
jgi:penicillin-binding protein 1C